MSRTIHMCLSVSGALANWTYREWKGVADDNHTTVARVKERFRIYEFEGKKVVPFGQPCKGFSYETGCPGHEKLQPTAD